MGSGTCNSDGLCGFHMENPNKEHEPCGHGWETRNERIKNAIKYHQNAIQKLTALWKISDSNNTLNDFGRYHD